MTKEKKITSAGLRLTISMLIYVGGIGALIIGVIWFPYKIWF